MKMNIIQQNLLSLLPLWSSVGPRRVISSIFLRLQDQAAPLSTSQIHSLISKSQKSSGELVTAFTAITFSKQWDNGTKKFSLIAVQVTRGYLLLTNNILIKLDNFVEKYFLISFLWLLYLVTTWSFLTFGMRRRFILCSTDRETTKYTWWCI